MEFPLSHPIKHSGLIAILLAATPACSTQAKITDAPESHSFLVKSDDNQIAGELIVMDGTVPETVIIVVGGSGAVLREDTRQAVPLFLNASTAVALVDRRGNGDSTGDYKRPSTTNSEWQIPKIGSDTADVATYLSTYGFDHVGVAGSSMGGWIAASAASQTEDIDFVIGLVGGVVSVATSDIFDGATDTGLSIPDAMIKAQQPHELTSYDPESDLTSMTQPGLWILTEKDTSNPSFLDIERLKTFKEKGYPYDYILVPNADHNMTDVESGAFNGSWIEPMGTFIQTSRDANRSSER